MAKRSSFRRLSTGKDENEDFDIKVSPMLLKVYPVLTRGIVNTESWAEFSRSIKRSKTSFRSLSISRSCKHKLCCYIWLNFPSCTKSIKIIPIYISNSQWNDILTYLKRFFI